MASNYEISQPMRFLLIFYYKVDKAVQTTNEPTIKKKAFQTTSKPTIQKRKKNLLKMNLIV